MMPLAKAYVSEAAPPTVLIIPAGNTAVHTEDEAYANDDARILDRIHRQQLASNDPGEPDAFPVYEDAP
jgi:hypothetical protein